MFFYEIEKQMQIFQSFETIFFAHLNVGLSAILNFFYERKTNSATNNFQTSVKKVRTA